MKKMVKDYKLGIIGGGNMSRAIIDAVVREGTYSKSTRYFFKWLVSGCFEYKDIQVSAKSDETLEKWKKLGVKTTKDNVEVIKNNDIIIVGVKPNIFEAAVNKIVADLNGSRIKDEKLFISLLVGITLDTLQKVYCHHQF